LVAPDRFWRRDGANVVALSGAPAADLNLLVIGEAAGAGRFLADGIAEARARHLPLLVLSAVPGLAPAGFANAGTVPLMALGAGAPVAPAGDCEVERVTEAGIAGRLQAEAFALPEAAMVALLAASLKLLDGPAVYLASRGGVPMSSVTVTGHGDTAGIWTMATPPAHQGNGMGRALLTRVMAEWRRAGTKRFYLIATPAGRPLYESLGFGTVGLLSAWTSG
jgi:GNAT superfamily N-acetyltransferase